MASVLTIDRGSDSWVAAPEKCRVSVQSSEKIGQSSMPAGDIYRVQGAVTCDAGWAEEKATALLRTFVFTTRVIASP